jgi:radical SAM protein with 4Fe4S-binding SPASM domain
LTRPARIEAPPAAAFWELTRACPLRCAHCRAVAEPAASAGLDDEEAMRVADELVALGARTVVLTGGEPTARRGWERIAARLASGGVAVRLFTSGFGFGEDGIAAALEAGVSELAVSLDGPKEIHDALRPEAGGGGRSSYEAAVSLMRALAARGIPYRAVTAVSRENAPHLAALYELVKALSAPRWQVQLCQSQGAAQENSARLMCDPEALERILSVLLRAAKERAVLAPLHCTVGYMTEEEPVLRNREARGAPVWRGCSAGVSTLAITPEGGVKGCAALPDEFATASVRERSLAEIWRDDALFPYTRGWSAKLLAGACAACSFGATCRAGCPAVAYGATGSVGLNPYCLRLVRGKRA